MRISLRVSFPKKLSRIATRRTRADWEEVAADTAYDNAFKVQWELFLRHVVHDEPFPWTLLEGAKGVQLAELGLRSWQARRWVEVPELK